jgi:hypothetical protein
VAAGIFADVLAGIARGYPRIAGAVAITAETLAVQTLVLPADPRWLDPVCAAWAAGHRVRLPDPVAFDPALLAAVRQRLAALAAAGTSGGEAVAGLAGLLHRWGPAAAAAQPELLAALPLAPVAAATALVAIGRATPATVPHLRAAALAGDIGAGVGLWQVAGDPAPLLAAVERALDAGGIRLAWQLTRAVPAGAVLGPVVARLRRYLTGAAAATHPQREVQVAAARIVWRRTGQATGVLPTVAAVLAGGDRPARAAAELAADLAEPALAPVLRERLPERWARVAAVRALWRLGEAAADLVPALVTAVEARYDVSDALALLVEMEAVAAVPDLVRLAERDERIVSPGIADDLVWIDERIQRDLRAAVTALTR